MNSRVRSRTASSRGLSRPARSSASCAAGGKSAAVVAKGNVGSAPRAGRVVGASSGGLSVTPGVVDAVGLRESMASSWRASVCCGSSDAGGGTCDEGEWRGRAGEVTTPCFCSGTTGPLRRTANGRGATRSTRGRGRCHSPDGATCCAMTSRRRLAAAIDDGRSLLILSRLCFLGTTTRARGVRKKVRARCRCWEARSRVKSGTCVRRAWACLCESSRRQREVRRTANAARGGFCCVGPRHIDALREAGRQLARGAGGRPARGILPVVHRSGRDEGVVRPASRTMKEHAQ